MRLLFLPGSVTSPAARFRVWQFAEPLRSLGHQVEVRVPRPEREWASAMRSAGLRRFHSKIMSARRICSAIRLLSDADRFDCVFMNRDIVPDPNVRFLEPWLAKKNSRLIFDFDDAIHLGGRAAKLKRILPAFAWLTPGNTYLAEFARELHQKVSIWPTVVNTSFYQPAKERSDGPVRIGWSGSKSTVQHCLPLLRDPICKASASFSIEFIVIADVEPRIDWPGVNYRYVKWTPASEVDGLQQIDIGLMPLRDEPFERGKCGLKAIQYMGCGIPALVSPVGVNKEIVAHGKHGFHCSTPLDWITYMRALIEDRALRLEMGREARSRTVEKYSVQAQLPQMLEVFDAVAGAGS
jgi:glycosyltransferase involved in cell wall biosynthesis